MAKNYKSYHEKLLDPRWQKKRLEIMERAGFKCEQCWDKTKTLHVHHSYYERGCDPWDYPSDSLYCLCEDCHLKVTEKLKKLQMEIGKIDIESIDQVIGYVRALTQGFNGYIVVDSRACAGGVSHATGLRHDEILLNLKRGLLTDRVMYLLYHKDEIQESDNIKLCGGDDE